MKLDVFAWSECSGDLIYPFPSQRLRLKASREVALFVQCKGFEVLAGVGTSFDIEVTEADCTFRIDGPKGYRAFVLDDAKPVFASSGECYTNTDRLPHQSGSVFEVKRALREQQLRHRDMLAEMRHAAAELRAARAAASAPAAVAAVPASPDPVSE